MGDETLTLLLKLKDEATAQLKSVRKSVAAVGAAIGAVGLKAGSDWDQATKIIVAGTGASGKALEGLQKSAQNLGKYGVTEAADAVQNLNTHLGLTGPDLERVAELALAAGIDTGQFGAVAKQTGRDVDGYAQLMNELQVASQATGVSTSELMSAFMASAPRFLEMGGNTEDLIDKTIELAGTYGGGRGLRSAMSEVLQEMETGTMPAIVDMTELLGVQGDEILAQKDDTDTWRDALRETKNELLAQIGPYGDVIGLVGTLGSAMLIALPSVMALVKSLGILKLAMIATGFGAAVVAIGLLVTAYITWKDEIHAFLKNAWNVFVGKLESFLQSGVVQKLAGLFGVELPENLDTWKASMDEGGTAVTDLHEAVKKAEEFRRREAAAAAREAAAAEREAAEAAEEAAKAHKELVKALAASEESLSRFTDVDLRNVGRAISRMGLAEGPIIDPALLARFENEAITWASDLPGNIFGPEFTAGVHDAVTEPIPPALKEAEDTMAAGWRGMKDDLKSTFSPDAITDIFRAAFTGGGGVLGALKAIGVQLANALLKNFATPLMSGLQGVLGGLAKRVGGWLGGLIGMGGGGGALASTSIGGALMGGQLVGLGGGAAAGAGAGAAGGAAGGAGGLMGILGSVPIWGWLAAGGIGAFLGLKGKFGPSKQELANRQTVAQFEDQLINFAREHAESYHSTVSDHVNKGWDLRNAEVVVAAQEAYLKAGLTREQASRDVGILWDQIENGSAEAQQRAVERIAAILQKAQANLEETADTAKDTSGKMSADFGDFFEGVTAEKAPELTEEMVKAFTKAGEAGQEFGTQMVNMFAEVGEAAEGAADKISIVGGAGLQRAPGSPRPGNIGNYLSDPRGIDMTRFAHLLGNAVNAQTPVLIADQVTGAVVTNTPRYVDFRGALP